MILQVAQRTPADIQAKAKAKVPIFLSGQIFRSETEYVTCSSSGNQDEIGTLSSSRQPKRSAVPDYKAWRLSWIRKRYEACELGFVIRGSLRIRLCYSGSSMQYAISSSMQYTVCNKLLEEICGNRRELREILNLES